MARKYLDCREFPGSGCTVALSADTEKELVEAAVQHGISTHGYQDSKEFRDQILQAMKEGQPRA